MYYPSALPDRETVAGVQIEYLEAGSGPTLLYLHAGEGADPDEALIQKLAQHYRVLMPAHPGFGASERPKHISTADDLAYFYLDYIEAKGLDDITLVGSSLGAWIALELASKSAARIRRLVLDNPVGVRFSQRTERDFIDLLQKSRNQWTQLFLAGAPADDRSWTEESATRAARNRESFTRIAWSPYLHNPKLKSRLHRVTAPTLVLWGDQDRIASHAYAEALTAALPDARLQTVSGAGHFAYHDQPDAVAKAIFDFALAREPA